MKNYIEAPVAISEFIKNYNQFLKEKSNYMSRPYILACENSRYFAAPITLYCCSYYHMFLKGIMKANVYTLALEVGLHVLELFYSQFA